jgi:hypothetical protein
MARAGRVEASSIVIPVRPGLHSRRGGLWTVDEGPDGFWTSHAAWSGGVGPRQAHRRTRTMAMGSAMVLYNSLTYRGSSSFHHDPTASTSRPALARIARTFWRWRLPGSWSAIGEVWLSGRCAASGLAHGAVRSRMPYGVSVRNQGPRQPATFGKANPSPAASRLRLVVKRRSWARGRTLQSDSPVPPCPRPGGELEATCRRMVRPPSCLRGWRRPSEQLLRSAIRA